MNEYGDELPEFVEESKENLTVAEQDFMALESKGEQADPNIINRAFRCVHSIKGGAGFLGMAKVGELAHSMEALMDLVRQNRLKPDRNSMGLMLEGVDHLNRMFEDAEQSNEYDITKIHGNIMELVRRISEGGTPPKKPQAQEKGRVDSGEEIEESVLDEGKKGDERKPQAAKEQSGGESAASELDVKSQMMIVEGCVEALVKEGAKGRGWIVHATEALLSVRKDAKERGRNNIRAVAEALDELLDDIDKERIEIEEETAAACQMGFDTLEKLVGNPDRSEEVDISPTCRTIALFRTSSQDTEASETGKAGEVETGGESTAELIRPEAVRNESNIPQKVEPKSVAAAEIIQPPDSSAPKRFERVDVKAEAESIRVKVSLLNHLMSLAGEMVLVRNQQLQLIDQANAAMRNNAQKLDMVTSELQECVMRTRMQPVGTLFNRFNRVVRDLGKKLKKEIRLEIMGGEVELDKSILEGLSDPLTHMIRNACDHGIEEPDVRRRADKPEAGNISLRAWHESGQVHIEVRDDGKGIDPAVIRKKVLEKELKTEKELASLSDKEILNLILLPGFTTAERVSDVSGRGVGMDVVRSNIEKIAGNLELDSVRGKGSAVRLQLPLTLAIIPSLIVRAGAYRYAIPQVNLEELVTLYNEEVYERIENARGREVFRLREQLLPMLRLTEILDRKGSFGEADLADISLKYRERQKKAVEEFLKRKAESKWGDEKFRQSLTFAVLKAGAAKFGLIVDEVIGTEEIVVKSMHSYLKDLDCYAGATVMGDGRVALILDVVGLANHGNAQVDSREEVADSPASGEAVDAMQSILTFRYGNKEQFGISLNMVSRIERIDRNRVEEIGEKEFVTIDGVSTRILRLDRLLNVSPFDEKKDTYLLLPKMTQKPYGILISAIEDSLDCEVELNTVSHVEPGLLGTSLIKGRLTLFVDLFKLIEKAEGQWSRKSAGPDASVAEQTGIAKRILLVEDVMFFRTLVKGYLKSAGYEVVTAENGKVGLEELKNRDFDLIVSDIEMPVMDGFEFIGAVRNILNNRITPALALTALDSETDIKRIREAGFDIYEEKIDRDRLLSSVGELLT